MLVAGDGFGQFKQPETKSDFPQETPVKESLLKLDLTPLLDLGPSFAMTPESLKKRFPSEGFSESPFIQWNPPHSLAAFVPKPFSNVSVDLSILDGAIPLKRALVNFKNDKVSSIRMIADELQDPLLDKLREKLNTAFGSGSVQAPKPEIGWKSHMQLMSELWAGPQGVAKLLAGADGLVLAMASPGTQPELVKVGLTRKEDTVVPGATIQYTMIRNPNGAGFLPVPSSQVNQKSEFFLRLDSLTAVPGLWDLTPAAFETRVVPPVGVSFKESPFYKWTTSAKDGVMLTRNIFRNTDTELLLFDDAVTPEEVTIEFRQGKAAKLTLTLLTRGNSGAAAAANFDTVFKATGRALGAMLQVQPTRTVPAGRSVAKIQGYLWTTPHTLALMEFNEDAPKGNVEFLRVKMMPASSRAELLNTGMLSSTITTKSRTSLLSNVKRDAVSGDVYLTGVPMIDQGQKGYCVSASCARIFNYLGVKCDQDEIAEVVKSDAKNGTDPKVMYAALKKIDQEYKMRVKIVKLGSDVRFEGLLKSELERTRKASLVKLIQDNVAAGEPLLWAVLLQSESPLGIVRPVFPGMQQGSGHMRLIIGYNTKSGEILYTDSWGAGHELKRMSFALGEAITQAVFTIQPTQ